MIGFTALIDGIQRHSRRMNGIPTEEERAAYARGVNHTLHLVNKLGLPVEVWVEAGDPLELGVGKRMIPD